MYRIEFSDDHAPKVIGRYVHKILTDIVDVDNHLPVSLWNYNDGTNKASEPYVLSGGGVSMNCQDCHLTLSDTDIYISYLGCFRRVQELRSTDRLRGYFAHRFHS